MRPMQPVNMQKESVGHTAGEAQVNVKIMLEISEKDFAIEQENMMQHVMLR